MNNRLREVRIARGWSQGRLIFAMRQEGASRGLSLASPASLKTQISRWENGHCQPDAMYRNVLAAVYGLSQERLGLLGDAGVESLGLGVPETWSDGVDEVTALWQVDLTRRSILQTSSFAVSAVGVPALKWMIGATGSLPAMRGSRIVGEPDVAAIREMTASFRRLDNAHGGGAIRDQAVRFLDREVGSLLRDGRYEGPLAVDLSRATAELTQLVGWMSYDEGMNGLAQRYFIQALNLARAAGDEPLGAEVLAAMSHQASHVGEGSCAVDLARAAARTATAIGARVLVAEASVLEAQGHAVRGDARACAHALHLAEQALDRADRSWEPQWLVYFDEAYLSAKFGHCFRALGRGAEAQRFAERSLNMDNAYVRGRAFNLALLADAFAQQHDAPLAAHWGHESLLITQRLRSDRAIGYLKRLAMRLAPESGNLEVARLRREVDQLASAA